MATEAALSSPLPPAPASGRRPASGTTVGLTLLLAAVLVALPFVTGGGVDNATATWGNTWTDIVLTLAGGLVTAVGIVRAPAGRPTGLITVLAFTAFTALTALSIIWSVTPDISWLAANQLLAYLAVFAAAVTLARSATAGWTTVIGAVALASAALCAWSLLAKIYPATLAAGNNFGRLQAPFGYWNALGVNALVGVPCFLWLGARRDRGRRLAALAPAAIALAITVLICTFSRSADLAAVVGAAIWTICVPLRLRTVVVTAIGGIGGAVISIWYLGHSGLSKDHVAMSAQDSAGHILGIVVLIVIIVMVIAGVVAAQTMDVIPVPERSRRGWGTALCAALACVPIVVIVGLAHSSRGLFGEISHGWDELTSSSSVTSDSATRVLGVGSSRPVYWHEALTVGSHALFKGVGALGFAIARLRWTTDPTVVQQAHSFVFQTFADLGIVGLLVMVALLGTWALESARTLAVRLRWSRLSRTEHAEREGMVVFVAIAVAFGVQSTLDWTWYFAGAAVPVLICAGWLAGRGPIATPGPGAETVMPERAQPITAAARRSILDRPLAAVTVLAVVGVALLGGWLQWQPLRSQQAIARVEFGNVSGSQILATAESAHRADPLSLAPLDLLATLYAGAHDTAAARRETVAETTLQPQNPNSWEALGEFELKQGQWRQALGSLGRALNLDIAGTQFAFLMGLRAIATAHLTPTSGS